jgi:SAM-dependent methyltransferase
MILASKLNSPSNYYSSSYIILIVNKDLNKKNIAFWNHAWYPSTSLRKNIELIFNQFELKEGSTVIDIGCGDSPYEYIFNEKACNYIKCDIDTNTNIKISEGKEIPLDDYSADFIVSFQVLEHVWDIEWYLSNCKRLLKNDGWLVLSTHGSWPYHPHPTDYRRWTRDGLVKEIESRGFKVEKIISIVGPLALTTQYRLLGLYEVLKMNPLTKYLILPPLAIFFNLIMIFEDFITPKDFKEKNACIYITVCKKEEQF